MITRTLFLAALSAALVFGQGPGREKRNFQPTELKAYLGLTDAQVTSIRDSNRAGLEAMKPLASQMREKAQALRELNKSDSADATAIGNAVLALKDLRKQMQANRTKIQEQAVALLSPEQKAKLTELQTSTDHRMEKRQAMMLQLLAPPAGGMGGPGGMRGHRGMRPMGRGMGPRG